MGSGVGLINRKRGRSPGRACFPNPNPNLTRSPLRTPREGLPAGTAGKGVKEPLITRSFPIAGGPHSTFAILANTQSRSWRTLR